MNPSFLEAKIPGIFVAEDNVPHGSIKPVASAVDDGFIAIEPAINT
ncbi:MAG TPA: hypothetical protein VIS71_09540 [Terrimicrobium sp.]